MTDLTKEAREGYTAATDAPCPHIETSPAADAFHVGRHLFRNGAPLPETASKGRGNSIRINGTHLFRLRYWSGGTTVEAI